MATVPLPKLRSVESCSLPKLLTVAEVAEVLRTTPKAVYGLVERGQIPGIHRVGRRLLFRQEALVQWLSEKSGTPSPEGSRR
ncbi:helix-turn-helix domain-containing protein [Anaeromyxobacter sp. SG66]|uniref:helix-turn-helix domain-containing protein n=1 Tax=Anaeromyxobacter sp. SG66 TaxID=2925410 RepID=UPI001F57BD21